MNDKLLRANGKVVRHDGSVYRIISLKLGSRVLVDAENVKSGERLNLMRSRSDLCKSIRNSVELNLVS